MWTLALCFYGLAMGRQKYLTQYIAAENKVFTLE